MKSSSPFPPEIIFPIIGFAINVLPQQLGNPVSRPKRLDGLRWTDEVTEDWWDPPIDISTALSLVLVSREWNALIEGEIYRHVAFDIHQEERLIRFYQTVTTSQRSVANLVRSFTIGCSDTASLSADHYQLTEVSSLIRDCARSLSHLDALKGIFWFQFFDHMTPVFSHVQSNSMILTKFVGNSGDEDESSLDTLYALLKLWPNLNDLSLSYLDNWQEDFEFEKHPLEYSLSHFRIGRFYIPPNNSADTFFSWIMGRSPHLISVGSEDLDIFSSLISFSHFCSPGTLREVTFPASNASWFSINNVQRLSSITRIIIRTLPIANDFSVLLFPLSNLIFFTNLTEVIIIASYFVIDGWKPLKSWLEENVFHGPGSKVVENGDGPKLKSIRVVFPVPLRHQVKETESGWIELKLRGDWYTEKRDGEWETDGSCYPLRVNFEHACAYTGLDLHWS